MAPNEAEERLRHVYLTLLEDDAYRADYDRVGVPAIVSMAADEDSPMPSIEYLKHFRTAVAAGLVPDPVALLYVANAFAKYLESNQSVSLNEAFGLSNK